MTPETSKMVYDSVGTIKKLLKTINYFCIKFLPKSEVNEFNFKIAKVDTTVDLSGSFMYSNTINIREKIKGKLEGLIETMLQEETFKFYRDHTIKDPKIVYAKGNLPTCLKFDVLDSVN